MLDDQGRLFGRINLIDAVVALFLVALLPLTYGAWVLFRAPTPVIESVTPVNIVPNEPNQLIQVQGRNMRPFLRAAIGSQRAIYLFDTPDQAFVKLPALPPGTYDLGIYDSQELARFPNAIKVQAKVVEMRVLVRFVTRPEVAAMVRNAERDVLPAEPAPAAARPILESFEVTEESASETLTFGSSSGAPNNWAFERAATGPARLAIIRGVVRLSALWTADGWQVDGRPLKAGGPFMLNAPSYVLQGEVLSLEVASAGK